MRVRAVDSAHLPVVVLILTIHAVPLLIIKRQILLIQDFRIIFLPLLLLLVHLPVCRPAEHEEGDDDQTAAGDGRDTQGFTRDEPVGDGHQKNRQQRGDRRQDGGGEGHEDEEGAGEDGVAEGADGEEPGGAAAG